MANLKNYIKILYVLVKNNISPPPNSLNPLALIPEVTFSSFNYLQYLWSLPQYAAVSVSRCNLDNTNWIPAMIGEGLAHRKHSTDCFPLWIPFFPGTSTCTFPLVPFAMVIFPFISSLLLQFCVLLHSPFPGDSSIWYPNCFPLRSAILLFSSSFSLLFCWDGPSFLGHYVFLFPGLFSYFAEAQSQVISWQGLFMWMYSLSLLIILWVYSGGLYRSTWEIFLYYFSVNSSFYPL